MAQEGIAAPLRKFIVKNYEIGEDDEFDDDVHLFDYGYVDSFGAVEIITFVENEFGVKITDQDLVLHSLNTVNEIASLVAERVDGAANA